MTTAGAETVIYSFKGAHGAVPAAGVIDVGGTLYGTTALGGAYNSGTIFSLTRAGVEQVLHSFQPFGGQFDGNAPGSALIAMHGVLYGTTGGCSISCQGAVFQMPLGGSESLLYPFVSTGAYPAGNLIATKGALHGTTSGGGYRRSGNCVQGFAHGHGNRFAFIWWRYGWCGARRRAYPPGQGFLWDNQRRRWHGLRRRRVRHGISPDKIRRGNGLIFFQGRQRRGQPRWQHGRNRP